MRDKILEGEKLFSQGDLEGAERIFKEVLQKEPENVEALNNLGVLAHARKDFQTAEDYFKKAARVEPQNLDPLLNLADVLEIQGKWKELVEVLERIVKLENKNIEFWNKLANVYIELKEFKKAYDAFSRSLEINPEQKHLEEILATLRRKLEHTGSVEVKSEKLNILFVQESPCIRNYKMARALRSKGHAVSLAYTRAKLSQMYKDLSDDVYTAVIHLQNHRQLWDISRNYDLIHCHNEPDFLTVAALAGEAPVIHDTHDLISLRADGDQNLAYFEGIANRGAHGRVYSTPYQMEEARRLYGVKGPSIVFYNYASESHLPKRFHKKLSSQDNKVHFVYEGGIGTQGHRDFLELFVEMAQKGIHIHIYPSFFSQELADFFKDYPAIHYYEPVSPENIIEEMTRYDYGIIPFNLEKGNKRFLDSTIANKLFEYLAAGLPVAASPLKSYKDYFQQNPVGVTFQNAEDLFRKFEKLKQIQEEVDFTQQIYTYEREIDRLIKFYHQIKRKVQDDSRISVTTISRAMSEEEKIEDSFWKLYRWIQENGWDGYDPYDLQDYFIQREKDGNRITPEKQREILTESQKDPVGVRERLGIKKKRNAKALGLLTSALVQMYHLYNSKGYLEEAEKIAAWLLANPSEGYQHLCWGYPFDWQSVIFIPRGTPSAVVSTTVGDGLWKLYRATKESKYLEACVSICEFIVNDLKRDDMGEQGVCFSYTPIDDYHVHNANLFCGEFLGRIGREIDRKDWLELAARTVEYAASEQNPDGSLYYWGRVQNHYAPNKLDHYHSGFEIRSLFHLSQHLRGEASEKARNTYQRYLRFYLNNYFLEDGTPKITPGMAYPVDIHGAAEAVLLLSLLSPEHKGLLDKARQSLLWTIDRMQTDEGWFAYRWTPDWRIDAPFLRWGQAWMLSAFTEYFWANKIARGEFGYFNPASEQPGRKARSGFQSWRAELNDLRELALSYARLDNQNIPGFLLTEIGEKLGLKGSQDKQFRIVLENLQSKEKWEAFIEQNADRAAQDGVLSRGDRDLERQELKGRDPHVQFMMPDTGGLRYGSKEWAEKLFQESGADPWGHDWRASQKSRYLTAMEMIKVNVQSFEIKKVLDIGCALGDFTNMLKEYFQDAEVLGVDISETAIQKCRVKYPEIKFQCASLPDLKIEEDGFDFVSALEVIYYVERSEIESSLKRIRDVITDGGYLLISTYLNKPPFVTPEDFKSVVSGYFEIIGERERYHGLYSQYETQIRQSLESVFQLKKILQSKSMPEINHFLQAGVNLLSNIELVNFINDYTCEHFGRKGLSHIILLARKAG